MTWKDVVILFTLPAMFFWHNTTSVKITAGLREARRCYFTAKRDETNRAAYLDNDLVKHSASGVDVIILTHRGLHNAGI